jgi:hypothetical protein
MEKVTILFGTDICRAVFDGDWEKVEQLVNDGDFGLTTIQLPLTSMRDIGDLMDSADGWGAYCFLTGEGLEKFNELNN